MHYVGLDVHEKTISYCLRQADGTIAQEGTIASSETDLRRCDSLRPYPDRGARGDGIARVEKHEALRRNLSKLRTRFNLGTKCICFNATVIQICQMGLDSDSLAHLTSHGISVFSQEEGL